MKRKAVENVSIKKTSNASNGKYDEEGVEILFEAMNIVAVKCDDKNEQFWIAQLLDDTIVEMLEDENAQVNVIYFELDQNSKIYSLGNYDSIPVQSIICEIHLDEINSGEFKLPIHHLQRIEKILSKIDAGEDVPEDMLQPLKKRKTVTSFGETKARSTKTNLKSGKSIAVKMENLDGLPKCCLSKPMLQENDRFNENVEFRSNFNDVYSSSKELIRAVLTKDYILLENILNDPKFAMYIYSFYAERSVDIPKTALHYAIELQDLKAISMIHAARRTKLTFAKKPVSALEYMESGRALSASRGGREGINALLHDELGDPVVPCIYESLYEFLGQCPSTTYEILMLFYPGNKWVKKSADFIPDVVRCGNYKLAHKLIGILSARGGWGFTKLHVQVLGSGPLEPFKRVSVLKKAVHQNIRPLHLAAINPNSIYLEALIAQVDHGSLGEVDRNGWQAVHYAAACEGPGPLKALIHASADLNARTKKRDVPLTIAAALGRVENVKSLLQRVVKTALEALVYGKRPLYHAAEHGHADVVEILIDHGADINAGSINKESALGIAAKFGHLNVVEILLKRGAIVDVRNKFRRTPLMNACMNDHIQVVIALLNAGANANAVDTSFNTVMHYAASYDSLPCVRVLHSMNATSWLKNSWGYSPMAVAALKGRYDCSRFLINNAPQMKKLEYVANIPIGDSDPIETVANLCLARGLEVHHQDMLGRTALHLGAASGAVVSSLSILHVSNPSLLEIMDSCGDTALGRAMAHDRKSMVTNLIQQGADINKQFTKGTKRYNMYFYAVQQKWQGVCHILLNAGYCRRQAVEDSIRNHGFQLTQNLITGLLNSQDKTLIKRNENGETLLHILAQQDVPFEGLVRSIAWQLVDAGVLVDAKTKFGETALHFAAVHGNLYILRFLLHLSPSLLNSLTTKEETPLLFGLKGLCAIEALSFPKVARTIVFFSRIGANLPQQDESGNSVLTVILDAFANSNACDRIQLLDLIERFLAAKVSPNGLVKTSLKIKCAPQSPETITHLTPLMRVIYSQSKYLREHLLALLLHFGAKINEKDYEGNTAIIHAIIRNQFDDVKILLGHVNQAERIANDGSTKVVTIKLSNQDRQEVLSLRNNYGQTALHLAVQPKSHGSYENVAMVELLLKENASTTALDENLQSPIDLAKQQSSGALLSVFTKTLKPAIASKGPFLPPPPENLDSTRYLSYCEAQGWVKSVRLPAKVYTLCRAGNKSTIYVDDYEYSVLLTKVDVQSGQHGINVFYRMQVVHNQIQDIYILFTNWGRIGENGKYQHTSFNDASSAANEFKKVFKSKTGNVFGASSFEKKSGKYMLFSRRESCREYDAKVTAPFDLSVESKLPPTIQEILKVVTDIRYLAEAASVQHRGLYEIPIAELKPEMLESALEKLAAIKEMIQTNANTLKMMNNDGQILEISEIASLSEAYRLACEELAEKSSRYYELIPQCDANSSNSLKAFMSVKHVNIEITRLRTLLEIAQTSKIILGAKIATSNPLDYCYEALQVHLKPSSSDEFDIISKYFHAGLASDAKYKVSRVVTIDRKGEVERMNSISVPGPHTLLWHGTKKSNLMGILSHGLRIAPPEAPVTGYAFGKGIYFADSSQKSLNYCDSPYILNDKRKVHYMLLCDVALGVKYSAYEKEFMNVAAEGTHSTFAEARCQPDPNETLTSKFIPCKIPFGKPKEIGRELPHSSGWALGDVPNVDAMIREYTDYNKNPGLRSRRLTKKGIELLEKALASGSNEIEFTPTKDINPNILHIFGRKDTAAKTVKVQVLSKIFFVSGKTSSCSCKITVVLNNNTSYDYSAVKYSEVYNFTVLPNGFKWQLPQPKLVHDEYIVYDEAQARICYLVEIECLQ